MGTFKLTSVEEMEAATNRLLETGQKVGADAWQYRVKNQTREHTNRPHSGHKNYLLDSVPEEVLRQVKKDE